MASRLTTVDELVSQLNSEGVRKVIDALYVAYPRCSGNGLSLFAENSCLHKTDRNSTLLCYDRTLRLFQTGKEAMGNVYMFHMCD